MAHFKRLDIFFVMRETGIIPVFYHKDSKVCLNVMEACYSGGARIFEFTNRGDFAHEVFAEISHQRAENYPDMELGAGSIMDSPTTSIYIQLGADFIVSPVLKEDMVIMISNLSLKKPGAQLVFIKNLSN